MNSKPMPSEVLKPLVLYQSAVFQSVTGNKYFISGSYVKFLNYLCCKIIENGLKILVLCTEYDYVKEIKYEKPVKIDVYSFIKSLPQINSSVNYTTKKEEIILTLDFQFLKILDLKLTTFYVLTYVYNNLLEKEKKEFAES